MNLKELTDEQLDAHRVEVLTEIERRQRLESIPAQVRDLATDYRAGGGDTSVLLDALSGE